MTDLKNTLMALFSNQAVIDGRKRKWFWTLIVIVLTLFLPWIPYLVSGYTTDYSKTFTQTSNYEIDKGFEAAMSSSYFKKITIAGSDDAGYTLTYGFTEEDYTVGTSEFTWQNEYDGTNNKELYKDTFIDESGKSDSAYVTKPTSLSKEFYFDNIALDTANQITHTALSSSSSTSTSSVTYEEGRTTYLEAYYIPELSINETNGTQFITNFIASEILNLDASSTAGKYPHSFTVFGKDFLMVYFYALKSSKSNSYSATFSGTFTEAFRNTSASGMTFYNYLTNSGNLTVVEAYKTNFASFLNASARIYGIQSTWKNIGILSAVIVGSMLICAGALMFMHKRKTSVYKEVNFWHMVQESSSLCLTPAIIAMVVGFFSISYLLIVYIACCMFRVVWIMNKICPPPEQSDSGSGKPLYQARS